MDVDIYDHAYAGVELMVRSLCGSNSARDKAFAGHLKLVAKAMREIDWADAVGDKTGSENKVIESCLTRADLVAVEREQLERMVEQLEKTVETVKRALESAGREKT